jgi:dTDP-4-dehydrorhamnose reductase
MTNVDACESDKAGCDKLNVDAVKFLVEAANQVEAHFIQLSTDFIFDGENGPYSENDEPNPLSYYGLSKLKAEEHITQYCTKWSIARTVLVYGIVHDMSRSQP